LRYFCRKVLFAISDNYDSIKISTVEAAVDNPLKRLEDQFSPSRQNVDTPLLGVLEVIVSTVWISIDVPTEPKASETVLPVSGVQVIVKEPPNF
jgi:hypothetical protein